VLLSAALSAAAGEPFPVLVQRRVLRPAGMTATAIDDPADTAGKATPYEPDARSVRPARPVDSRCKWGAGAYVSTAEDIARFGIALLTGQIISRSSLESMITPMTDAQGASTAYGMGLGIARDSSGVMRVGHTGSAMGGRAALIMYPEQRVVAVILSNVEGDGLSAQVRDLANLFLPAGRSRDRALGIPIR
jgi:CubicO group peptidase (beta-lactamase class C family)